MVRLKTISRIAEALPNSLIASSGSKFLITDKFGELLGQIDEEMKRVVVYKDYEHHKKITTLLKKKGFEVNVREMAGMEEVSRIIYGDP